MKPTSPTVPTPIWKDLYAAAAVFQALRPWEVLGDHDVVGVRDSSTGETGYSVVMGSGGTLYGLCCYREAEGFDIYQRLLSGDIGLNDDELFAMQNCLKLELGPRSNLKKEDHAVIRLLGLAPRGKNSWPEFRSLLPGYAPWFLTEAEARFFTIALGSVCRHCEKVVDGEIEESLRDNECLVYSSVVDQTGEYIAAWEPWPGLARAPVVLPLVDPARIKAVHAKNPKPDSPWQADVLYFPSTIHDRERPYFMRVAVVCQRVSGFVFDVRPAYPETPSVQSLADVILASIEKHGFLPETVFVKKAQDASALIPLGRSLGVTIRHQKTLRAVEMLKKEMMERFVYSGGGG
jgi:hypothetical protein